MWLRVGELIRCYWAVSRYGSVRLSTLVWLTEQRSSDAAADMMGHKADMMATSGGCCRWSEAHHRSRRRQWPAAQVAARRRATCGIYNLVKSHTQYAWLSHGAGRSKRMTTSTCAHTLDLVNRCGNKGKHEYEHVHVTRLRTCVRAAGGCTVSACTG